MKTTLFGLSYGEMNESTYLISYLPLLMRFSYLMPLSELVRLYHAANDDTRKGVLRTIIQIRFNV